MAYNPPGIEQLTAALQRTLPMANLELVELPGCAPVRLALINANFPTGPLPADVMRAVIEQPAYWAFCWGSGLGLAQFLLARPSLVAGKHVIDLGSGSGVAGIAAARAGAARVTACDLDADARLATAVNAQINAVDLDIVDDLDAISEAADLLLMADVLYDRGNWPLLEQAGQHARDILVADSRVAELPERGFTKFFELEARTLPNLGEFDEFSTVHLFRRGERLEHGHDHLLEGLPG